MPINTLAERHVAPHSCSDATVLRELSDMTICEEIEIGGRSGLPRFVKLFLFVVMQGIAAILVGFAALFLSFDPVWSAADRPQATFAGLSDARSGSLILKTD